MSTRVRDFNTSIAFALGLVAWTDLFTYHVPSRSQMLITNFSNYMAIADWGEVTWRILRVVITFDMT